MPPVPCAWSLLEQTDSQRSEIVSLDLMHAPYARDTLQRADGAKSDLQSAAPKFHLPFNSELQRHKTLHITSTSSIMFKPEYRRAVSLDLERRTPGFDKVQHHELKRSLSTAQLRGGANRNEAGILRWLKRTQSMDQKLVGRSNDGASPSITFKGREIGPPQLDSPLNVLPPASRFVNQSGPGSTEALSVAPPDNAYNINGNQQQNVAYRNRAACVKTPPLPPPLALRDTPSRPATTNPFAGIYGNPNILRVGPVALTVDHALAGSLVDRPSALDGPQATYGPLPATRDSAELRGFHSSPKNKVHSHHPRPGFKSETHKVWADRKWDALPALPPEAEALESPLEDQTIRREEENESEQPLDTEHVLKSLRPERLGLHHINSSGRPMNDLADADNNLTDIVSRASGATTRRSVRGDDTADSADEGSIRTRDWDLQSCDTDDLGIDARLEKQRELAIAQRAQNHRFSQGQRRQQNVRDNNETLSGLSEEDSVTPESIFYNELISTVTDYDNQLHRVIQRAYEAGEMSDDHYLREQWRHRTSMERKLQAAEDASGYRVRESRERG